MAKFHLKVVTPEREIFDNEVEMITTNTSNGEITILPNHTNLTTKITPGELIIRQGSIPFRLATGEGLLTVQSNQVKITIDLAIASDDIDEKAAEQAKKRAEEALEQKLTDEEYATTMALLEKSLAQLKVKRRHHAV